MGDRFLIAMVSAFAGMFGTFVLVVVNGPPSIKAMSPGDGVYVGLFLAGLIAVVLVLVIMEPKPSSAARQKERQ